jgi:hypothetical protein
MTAHEWILDSVTGFPEDAEERCVLCGLRYDELTYTWPCVSEVEE